VHSGDIKEIGRLTLVGGSVGIALGDRQPARTRKKIAER